MRYKPSLLGLTTGNADFVNALALPDRLRPRRIVECPCVITRTKYVDRDRRWIHMPDIGRTCACGCDASDLTVQSQEAKNAVDI